MPDGPLIGQQRGELGLCLSPLLAFAVEPRSQIVDHRILVSQKLSQKFDFSL